MVEPVLYAGMWLHGDNVEQDQQIIDDVFISDCYRLQEVEQFETVLDVGAHIGAFATLAVALNRSARVFCYECCPENIPLLARNVSQFATVVQAAVTYDTEIALLNAIFPNCESTGGSTVCHPDQLNNFRNDLYWADTRPLVRATLESIIKDHSLDFIDVLKMDCESCELNVLERSTSLSRVKRIIGEWHGKDRFMTIRKERLSNWRLTVLRDGEIGLFWLENPELSD
jgi:FkbM family methyltransferase